MPAQAKVHVMRPERKPTRVRLTAQDRKSHEEGMSDRLTRLERLVTRIADGDLDEPVVFDGDDEVARLSQAIGRLVRQARENVNDRDRPNLEITRELTDIKAALDAHSIVAITDAKGKITYVNEKFCQISKFTREELLGQDHRIINSGYHPKAFFTDLWKTIRSGKVWKGEIKNRAKDSSFYWVDTTIFPFLGSDGKPRQYVAIRTDTTKRKEDELRLKFLAEELAAKNKEMETIVYVVSHDLRSPLLNVQGFGNALARACAELKENIHDASDPEVTRVLEIEIPRALRFIEAGVAKMDGLLNGFLRFSRLGRVALQIQPLSLQKIVQNAVYALKYQTEQAGAIINVGKLPAAIGDSTLIGQVFSNLIENALKYRDPRRPCHIAISGRVAGNESIYEVRDNGIGIAPEHQPKIFELFHRLNPKETPGDGMGLSLAQRILERQHGRIWVESEYGKGAAFHISLPSICVPRLRRYDNVHERTSDDPHRG